MRLALVRPFFLTLVNVAGENPPSPSTAEPSTERAIVAVDVHLVLRRGARILLGERRQTGFADGFYHLPSGHVEEAESIVDALVREAREELGIDVDEEAVELVHVMHNSEGGGRVAFFFEAARWSGEIVNREPEKCRRLVWLAYASLPERVVPYTRAAIESALVRGERLSLFGWPRPSPEPY